MSDFALVETLFTNLLNASKVELTDAELGEMQTFIDVGEYGLALETAAEIYAEEEKIPSADGVSLIERLAIALSMKPDSVLERLRK